MATPNVSRIEAASPTAIAPWGLKPPADSRSVLPVLMSELAFQVALFSRDNPPPDNPHKQGGQQQRPPETKPARDAHVQEQHSQVHRVPGEPIRTVDDKRRRWPHRDHTRPGGPEAPHARGREHKRGESEHRSQESSAPYWQPRQRHVPLQAHADEEEHDVDQRWRYDDARMIQRDFRRAVHTRHSAIQSGQPSRSGLAIRHRAWHVVVHKSPVQRGRPAGARQAPRVTREQPRPRRFLHISARPSIQLSLGGAESLLRSVDGPGGWR